MSWLGRGRRHRYIDCHIAITPSQVCNTLQCKQELRCLLLADVGVDDGVGAGTVRDGFTEVKGSKSDTVLQIQQVQELLIDICSVGIGKQVFINQQLSVTSISNQSL